jgi:hypothetical protein
MARALLSLIGGRDLQRELDDFAQRIERITEEIAEVRAKLAEAAIRAENEIVFRRLRAQEASDADPAAQRVPRAPPRHDPSAG